MENNDAPVLEKIGQLQTLLAQQKFSEAEDLAGELTVQFPLHGFAWHVMGALRLHQGRFEESMPYLATAEKFMPNDPEVYNNLGCALERLGRLQEAETSYRRALAIKPDFTKANHNLGVILRELGHYRQAEVCLRDVIKILPDYADAYFNLGLTLAKLNQSEEAAQNFQQALQINPRHTHALVALGNAAASLGKFSEAQDYYLQVLAIQPENLAAWSAIPEIRKMTVDDLAWLQTSLQVLPRCGHPREASRYYFALGKYYDDVGDYGSAFQQYQRANELSKQLDAPYQPEREAAITDRICATFSKEKMAVLHEAASRSERPVFIVGMPRSGTSLVEQIVASHPLVSGAGELNFWSNAMPNVSTATESEGIHFLADAYLNLLSSYSVNAARVIDKAPHNFKNLGLIHTVFPQARILHLQRNPIDTCLSIYFQDFSTSFSFANDLHSLAHYYREYLRLMAHWRATIPAAQFLDVPYDALVQDQERWSRKIIDFLGLEWDPRCLDFQHTKRKVETASQWQVRQGMYKTSVERWRKYEPYLGPLLGLADAQ